ncbi:hypothetical protein A9Q74_07405 [Colwellia sp. 39_35_sub15_T18]|nr:hypothetical protein A9Q74_07405 [Colwellia sp. 39_35_sub15_T18]
MKKIDNNLSHIIKSLKSSYGTEFFNSLTLQLHQLIASDYTFIAKLDKDKYVSQTISLVAKGEISDNFEYSLIDTPCANVSDDTACIYLEKICQLYPSDQLLIDMKIEGYIGTPLHDSNGEIIGLIVALYEHAITNSDTVTALFDLFSGRISAELEREDKEKQLTELNDLLEEKVNERTSELSSAIDRLRFTQDKLIEQEKMASLGNLVAGIAHEINTPLGVAVLCSSNIEDALEKLNSKIESNSLTKSELESLISTLNQSEESLSFNLRRAANLVDNFKEMAVSINSDDLIDINISSWLNSLVGSLRPMLYKKNITVELLVDEHITSFTTCPAKMSQVFTNIISNSSIHAFEENDGISDRNIIISTKICNDILSIKINDNGKGMTDETIKKIFEPFYTTKRGKGGTGLGLSIVHNIIINNLSGKLAVESTVGKGTCFNLEFPALT